MAAEIVPATMRVGAATGPDRAVEAADIPVERTLAAITAHVIIRQTAINALEAAAPPTIRTAHAIAAISAIAASTTAGEAETIAAATVAAAVATPVAAAAKALATLMPFLVLALLALLPLNREGSEQRGEPSCE